MLLRFDLGCSQVPGPQCRTRLKENWQDRGLLCRDPDAASESLRCFLLGSLCSVQDRSEYSWLSCGNLVLCVPGDCEDGELPQAGLALLLASGL